MFMRENRRKNGVEQPEVGARRDAASQKSARKLDPNEPLDQRAEDWRFTPDLSSPEKINDAHYGAGIDDEPYTGDYIEHIPFVGVPDTMKRGKAMKEA